VSCTYFQCSVSCTYFQCTVSCGGGTQQRNVQCINLETDQAADGCKNRKPATQQVCGSEQCSTVSAGKLV